MAKEIKEIPAYQIVRDIDVTIVDLFSKGLTAKRISAHLLKEENITMSNRTVEGMVEHLKAIFHCDSMPHLVGTFFRQKLIK